MKQQSKYTQILELILLMVLLFGIMFVSTRFSFVDDLKPDTPTEKYIMLAGIIVMGFVVLGVHELGHLLVGLMNGFRFQLYVVGPLGIKREEDKVKIYLNKNLSYYGGIAGTSPQNDSADNAKIFAKILLAGPIASILFAILCFLLAFLVGKPLGVIFYVGALISIAIFLATTVPSRTGLFFTDRKRYQRLVTPGKDQEVELAMLSIMGKYAQDNSYQNGEGMYIHPSGELLAPPFIKNMEHDLKRRISTTVQETFHTLTASTLQKQAEVRFHVGQVLAPKNHMTIDEAWMSQWKSLSYNCQRIENDAVFTRKLGFNKRPIPYQAMIHYGIAQVVDCFSSYSKYHLGVLEGRQIRPAYSGDTFAVEMCITRMTPSSNGAYVIVESKINISNQDEALVLQMRRRSLFDAFEIPATTAPIPERFLEASLSEEQLAIEQQILAIPSSENTLTADQLRNVSLIRHDITSMLDLSQSSLYCHFFRNVHPLHLNHLRFDKVAMSGGVILPVVCGIVKAELGAVYWEELLQTAHLNPVRDGDLVGAMSYIVRQTQIAANTIELTLRTYGIRNLDVMNDLADLPIPQELFLHEGLKPSEMERMLHLCCPKLSRKLVIKVDWKVRVGVCS
ncbi:MAG: site-2 protease family protein [Bacteroidota bacterium]